MRLQDDKPLTIALLVEKVFPDLTKQAVQLWMSKGIFTAEKFARGRHGCELSLSDAVCVGVLHSLFNFGVSFRQISVSGLKDPFPVNPITFLSKEAFGQSWFPQAKNDPRSIQEYLEYTDYRCHVYYEPKRGRSFINDRYVPYKGGKIYFFPST